MSTFTWRICCLVLALGLGLIGCWFGPIGCWSGTGTSPQPSDDESEGPVWFADVTEEVGLDFIHDAGAPGTYFMPQSMGAGAAFIHDPDGSVYLLLLQTGGPDSKSTNRLYKRVTDGKGKYHFKDVSAGSGLDINGYNLGVAIGDVNNDGLPDVFISQYGSIKLFLNLGGGRFEDVTVEAGLRSDQWGASALFFDYDRDGWLDLFVANYVSYDPQRKCVSASQVQDYCGPANFPGTCAKLFRNLGPGKAEPGKKAPRVRFQDVSFESGIGQIPGPGLGVVAADFNGDGWPDVFVANDGQPNRLWMNQGKNEKGVVTFKEEAVSRGVALTGMGKVYAGMGIALGDSANRGLLDLYVTHLSSETNTLWRQKLGPKRGEFQDRTVEAGLLGAHWHGTGFGTLFADFDHDGSLDLAIVNGRVYHGGPAKDTKLGFWETYAEKNQLLMNDGTGKFRDVSLANKAFCGYWNVARGLVCDDIDDDGALDLVVTTVSDRARVFRNIAAKRGHWLQVRAFDPKANRDAYGAEVHIKAGGREQLRVVNPGHYYLCSGSPLAHFGLGQAETVTSILVHWPDGTREGFAGCPADQTIVVRKGEGARP